MCTRSSSYTKLLPWVEPAAEQGYRSVVKAASDRADRAVAERAERASAQQAAQRQSMEWYESGKKLLSRFCAHY
eukprot:SAG31_NODE_21512_length_547_cov_2.167411_1_plen_74_part_00